MMIRVRPLPIRWPLWRLCPADSRNAERNWRRCGNANLITLIPTLALKQVYSDRLTTAIDAERLTGLNPSFACLRRVAEPLAARAGSLCGRFGFRYQAGIHASALLKDPRTYEHVVPESVGNFRKVMVSDQGGKSNFLNALEAYGN